MLKTKGWCRKWKIWPVSRWQVAVFLEAEKHNAICWYHSKFSGRSNKCNTSYREKTNATWHSIFESIFYIIDRISKKVVVDSGETILLIRTCRFDKTKNRENLTSGTISCSLIKTSRHNSMILNLGLRRVFQNFHRNRVYNAKFRFWFPASLCLGDRPKFATTDGYRNRY